MKEEIKVLIDGGMTLEEALRQLEKIEALREEMKRGVVEFRFRKKDGSERVAHGTLDLRETGYEFKGAGPKSAGIVPYWDCDKLGWRSFTLASLI